MEPRLKGSPLKVNPREMRVEKSPRPVLWGKMSHSIKSDKFLLIRTLKRHRLYSLLPKKQNVFLSLKLITRSNKKYEYHLRFSHAIRNKFIISRTS